MKLKLLLPLNVDAAAQVLLLSVRAMGRCRAQAYSAVAALVAEAVLRLAAHCILKPKLVEAAAELQAER